MRPPSQTYPPPENPYLAPTSIIGPAQTIRVVPDPESPPPLGLTLSVRFDLSDDDLKRCYGLDFFYDPMPLAGFIPQWVIVPVATLLVGLVAGLAPQLMGKRSAQSLPWVLPVSCVVAAGYTVWFSNLRMRLNRRELLRHGFGTNRVVTITEQGLRVETDSDIELPPKFRATGIGTCSHPWVNFRRVEVREGRYLFLWRTGRNRIVIPLQAFRSPSEADQFARSAACWMTAAPPR